MAAVIAAIGAAFLAGGVALFREHRSQQRRLLTAARVVYATFGVALGGLTVTLKTNGWAPLNNLPGESSFSTAWETYKSDLAGHLTWEEWVDVERAVNRYASLFVMSKDKPPSEADATDVLQKAESELKKGREKLHLYCVKRFTVWALVKRWWAEREKKGD